MYGRSVLLVFLAGVCWSVGGVMLRCMESATGPQVLFYRAVGMTIALLLILALRYRQRLVTVFRATGIAGVVGSLCLATAFTSNIFSMLHTTVATTLFMQSTQIFFAAVLGWVFLQEMVRPATWIAMAVALTGVGVMVAEGVVRGTLAGGLLGLVTGMTVAGFAVALRAGHTVDMLPCACFAGVFSAIAGGLMVDGLAVTPHDFGLCLVMGVVQLALGFTLFTMGASHVPAAELMVVALSEVVLAPFWVWLGIGERPSALTLLGGAIIMAAIVGLAMYGMQRKFVTDHQLP